MYKKLIQEVVKKKNEMIKKRKQYFEEWWNEEYPRVEIHSVEWNLGVVDLRREEKVKRCAVKKNKKREYGIEPNFVV